MTYRSPSESLMGQFDLDESQKSENDVDWADEILKRSFLKFFPELHSAIIQSGEVKKFSSDVRIFKANSLVDSLIMPLNCEVSLSLVSGRLADDSRFDSVQPFDSIGCAELMDGKTFPFSLDTETDETLIFYIPKSIILPFVRDPKIGNLLRSICTSSAIFDFGSWLLEQGVDLPTARAILQEVKTPTILPKQQDIQFKSRSLLLIDSGLVQAILGTDDIVTRIDLQNGDWFGASVTEIEEVSAIEFAVIQDTSVYSIEIEKMKILGLQQRVLDRLAQEPCIQKMLNSSRLADTEAQIKYKSIMKYPIVQAKGFGYTVSSSKLKVSDNDAHWIWSTIWNLLQFLNFDINEKQVAALVLTRSSMGLGGVAQTLEDLGLYTQIKKLPRGRWVKMQSPFYAFIQRRPCLVVGEEAAKIWILDPKDGLISIKKNELYKSWNRVCLQVSMPFSRQAFPENFEQAVAKPEIAGKGLIDFFLNLSQREIFNLTIFRLFQSLAVIFIPTYLIGMVNQIVTNKRFEVLPIYYTGLGLFIAFQVFALFFSGMFQNYIFMRSKAVIQPYIYRLLLSRPNTFVTSIRAGFIQSQLSLIDFAIAGMKAYRIDMIQYGGTFLLFLAIITFHSWKASLVILFFAAAGFGLMLFLQKKTPADVISVTQTKQDVVDCSLDFLASIESVKSSHSEKLCRSRLENLFTNMAKSSARFQKATAMGPQWASIIFQVGTSIALFLVVQEILGSENPPVNAIALSLYLSYCLGPYMGMLNIISTYKTDSVMGVPGQLIKFDSKIRLKSSKIVSLQGGVRFEKVSFRYSDRSPISLSEVSFNVLPGETVAIVGRSGSGKTTLGRVLSRQVEHAGGRILFDEIDSRAIEPASLQSQIGFVSQTPALFSGSIAQNIALSDDVLDERDILAAAKAAGADKLIENLPGKLNYYLKEGGKGLSVGQRQMIALARVLYSKPKILILDEATAHLDPKTERIISDQLLGFQSRQTVFIIVQTISTAARADKIVVLKNGRIVEIGDHNSLIANNGEYAELFRHQLGGAA
jgi:ABC-type bacteriocin/lantibiotic exporter with double-glycine peptidase domain